MVFGQTILIGTSQNNVYNQWPFCIAASMDCGFFDEAEGQPGILTHGIYELGMHALSHQ